MKVEVTETQEFKPIVLTITIESKEELVSLYSRLNLSGNNDIVKEQNRFNHDNKKLDELRAFYDKITDILVSL